MAGQALRLLRLRLPAFGLVNPVLYLVVLAPWLEGALPGGGHWAAALAAGAWILLGAFWTLRMVGAGLDPRWPATRAGVRTLLVASLTCLLLYTAKDAWALLTARPGDGSWVTLVLHVLRLGPLYLVPAVLLADYLRQTSSPAGLQGGGHGLFLLPGGAARAAVAAAASVALLALLAANHRRSETSVRRLVSEHAESMKTAAARYDVDPLLIASIVYVTHRDQLSPFRDSLERLAVSAWAVNLRRELAVKPPDRVDEIGTDENPLLNRSLDVSVGLAQVKPRTALTASVLATGATPEDLPRPVVDSYRDVEPVGEGWKLPAAVRMPTTPPIPVPAEREVVARALLDAPSNLALCALILALYQRQWEAANPAWSLRQRPDVLATLYQIGFARSKPHAAPRSNAFGRRVREILEQPWLADLLSTPPSRPSMR